MVNQKKDAKQKKLLRLQENAKAKAESQAVKEAVKAANLITDPLQQLPIFRRYSRQGLDVELQALRPAAMAPALRSWALQLCKANMADMYAQVWGWHEGKKEKELFQEEEARFLVATQAAPGVVGPATPAAAEAGAAPAAGKQPVAAEAQGQQQPVAFVHYRFEEEDGDAVLYCYELQLEPGVQGKGLGRFMMQALELMAWRAGMLKVMLTVFDCNGAAGAFYAKMGYALDETSPEYGEVDVESKYHILSKRRPGAPKLGAA